VPTIIVWGTLGISTTVLLEATLSFLGIGVQPPTPSWGTSSSRTRHIFRPPHGCLHPGLCIILLALAFNLVGDTLREILDPTQKGATDGGLPCAPAPAIRDDPRRHHAGYVRAPLPSAADPARQIAGRSATPEVVENIRHQLGLDLPLYRQYFRYVTALAHGDLGRSYVQKSEVAALIWSRLPATLLLMLGSIVCELAIGLTLASSLPSIGGGLSTRC